MSANLISRKQAETLSTAFSLRFIEHPQTNGRSFWTLAQYQGELCISQLGGHFDTRDAAEQAAFAVFTAIKGLAFCGKV